MRTLREAILVYGGAIFNGGALFLLNILLARTLSKDAFGAFSLAVLVLGTVAELSDFGLNAGFLRFAPYYLEHKELNKLKQLVKTVWRWRVIVSAILTVGGIALATPIGMYIFKQPSIIELLRFSFLGIGGVILLGFITTYLQASQRFTYTALLQALKGLLRLVISVILLVCGVRNLYIIISVYLFIPWILMAATYSALPHGFQYVKVEEEVKKKLHSQLARFSFWLTVWSLMSIISSRIDQAMISSFLNLSEVATYSVAFQFMFIYTVALQSLTSVLLPKINRLDSKAEIIAYCKKIFYALCLAALGLAVLIYPSQFIIELLFGQKYAASMPVYLVLAYSTLINFITIPLSLIITVFNRTELIAISGFIQLIINVFANLVLIPRYGIMGAAMTFAIGIVLGQIYNGFISYFLLKKTELRPL